MRSFREPYFDNGATLRYINWISVLGIMALGKRKEELLEENIRLKERIAQLESSNFRLATLEEALEKSDTKFKRLTDKSVVGVYLIQNDVFVYVNPKLAEIFGYSRQELVRNLPVTVVVYPEDRHLLETNLKSRLSGQIDSMNYQFRGLKKDGSVLYIEAYGSRMDYQGAPAVIGSLIDITSRVESERALRQSEHLYKTLVEEINDGYFVVQDKRVTFANEAFCRMHGARLEQVLGRMFSSFVSPEHRGQLQDIFDGVCQGRPSDGLQYSRVGFSREKAATEIKARVADLGNGPAIIGICRDISERAKMESRMREHERMAYIGQLSASLSHEIRNPLSSIKMNLQLLARNLNLNGNDNRRLEITVHEVSRLENILRQLLDVARPLAIQKAPTDVSALSRACIELLQAKTQEKRIQVIEQFPRALPLVDLDGGKIEQALINLLLNAIDATPNRGTITVWAKIRRKAERSLELGIRDSGPGIDKNQLPQLFTPFITSKSHGCGLGLSNVKRIVEAHSGEVVVRTKKSRGATFILRFPCSP
jgi:PAS domain S-box-containing protein